MIPTISVKNILSFMSANFVARQSGYRMTGGWDPADKATNDYFQPLETFETRFEALLLEVKGMGFEAMDLWSAHLNPQWATTEHVSLARSLLKRHGLIVPSLAGAFGKSRSEFEAVCKMASALDVGTLGGLIEILSGDRAFVVRMLRQYNLRLAIENHPEKTPEEMLEKIGDGAGGRIGTALDTGWYEIQGCDAVQAIQKLERHILHVHLKDVLAPGAHKTCRYGSGCVSVRECVQTLKAMDFSGVYSVEHEPETFDPTADCVVSREMLQGWLAS